MEFIDPQFKTLLSIVPPHVELDQQMEKFCQDTFILKDPNPPVPYTACEDAKKFIDVVNQNVRQLILSSHLNYVQCFGQEYKDYSLFTKSLNFGKTILESSLLEKLSEMLGLQWTKQLIYGYAIVMKYKEDYFQVSGIQLPDQLKKPFDKKKKIGNKNTLSYSS